MADVEHWDLTADLAAQAFSSVAGREEQRVRAWLTMILPPGHRTGEVLEAEDAYRYLHVVREAVEHEADRIAQVYTPVEWLWYTRRIPWSEFRGHLITTEISDHALMETLTGLSRNSIELRRTFDEYGARYDLSSTALRPVARVAALARVLGQVHAWIRRAGKGSRFIVRSDGLPETEPNEVLDAAITNFDVRIAADLRLIWHPGVEVRGRGARAAMPLFGAAAVYGEKVSTVPGWQGRMSDGNFVQVRGRYTPVFLTLHGLEQAAARVTSPVPTWWRSELPSLVALLQSLAWDVMVQSEFAGITVPNVGYLLRGREWLTGLLDAQLPELSPRIAELFLGHVPATGRQVLADVERLKGVCWPHVRGPVLRSSSDDRFGEYQDQVTVDLVAATQQLRDLVTIPGATGGQLVNVNAERLELAVQDLLDRSPWRPSSAEYALRRRTLRIGGDRLTDVDAIGAHDGTLLLIDCKNYHFTPLYNGGDFATVRNVRTALEGDVTAWRKKVATLTAHPVGDNFDLSGYRRLVGAVVTPHVFFTLDLHCRQVLGTTASGTLRRSSSLGELSDFVSETTGLTWSV